MAREKKLICCSCKKETITEISSIGDMESATKYRAVFNADCSLHWLCEECKIKAYNLAKELQDMFDGDDTVALFNIMN